MATPASTDTALTDKLICSTCKGRGEVSPAVEAKGIKSVVCPTCKGYGAPKPAPAERTPK